MSEKNAQYRRAVHFLCNQIARINHYDARCGKDLRSLVQISRHSLQGD